MRNEMKLLENTACPDAVRVWWRNIWLEKDKRKLANHTGQPQLDGKLLKEVYSMLPQDLRRDVDQMNVRLHRPNKATLNGQQTLRLWYDSLEGVSHEKDMFFFWKRSYVLA